MTTTTTMLRIDPKTFNIRPMSTPSNPSTLNSTQRGGSALKIVPDGVNHAWDGYAVGRVCYDMDMMMMMTVFCITFLLQSDLTSSITCSAKHDQISQLKNVTAEINKCSSYLMAIDRRTK